MPVLPPTDMQNYVNEWHDTWSAYKPYRRLFRTAYNIAYRKRFGIKTFSSQKSMSGVKRGRSQSMPPTPMKTARSRSRSSSRGRPASISTKRSSSKSSSRASRASTRISGVSSSKSIGQQEIGYLKTSKSVKSKARSRSKPFSDGVTFIAEACASSDGAKGFIIGHGTHPVNLVYKGVAFAIVKKLMMKMGFEFTSFATVCSTILGVGSQITLSYRNTPDGNIQNRTYTIVANDTLQIIADDFADFMLAQDSSTFYNDIEFVPYTTVTTFPRYVMKLKNGDVEMKIYASLKWQNRSVEVVGDDAEDVNNVPIQGVSYEGTGTGTTYIDPDAGGPFYIVRNTGLLAEPIAGDAKLKEPPSGVMFAEVKKTGNFRCGPGSIRESVLTYHSTMSLDKLQNKCGGEETDPRVSRDIGKFRFSYLEKLIGLTVSGRPDITTAYENYWRGEFRFIDKKTKYTPDILQVPV